ncbi:uncharacterized protein [Triticum aestivum]|uniref:uncharacterized protein n=1 Tax=Triticum aestivum TaxID=4565 RepID=UPI001D0218AB|nr:uncharacterized protein LOC123046511 [Triticum aestivum]XP_044325834.1 uncharacterized protein LOC123046511 [Triticum aestivum]
MKSVQLQLGNANHDITACQMFFVPVILDHGWAVYMWDMFRKEIHVLDPLCAQVAGEEQRHMTHQEAISQIHTALFSCFNEFFVKWHCLADRWKRKFPRITRDVFIRDESGMCMLHAIRHYDGDKMMWPLTRKNLATFRQTTIFEVFRLRDKHGIYVRIKIVTGHHCLEGVVWYGRLGFITSGSAKDKIMYVLSVVADCTK